MPMENVSAATSPTSLSDGRLKAKNACTYVYSRSSLNIALRFVDWVSVSPAFERSRAYFGCLMSNEPLDLPQLQCLMSCGTFTHALVSMSNADTEIFQVLCSSQDEMRPASALCTMRQSQPRVHIPCASPATTPETQV
jgi:hypothetical protein